MSTNDDERQARLAQIRERLEAATPGPWGERSQDDWMYASYSSVWAFPPGKPKVEVIATDWNDPHYPQPRQEDCDLIANAPADIAWLLAELEAATARAERAEAALRLAEGESAEFTPWIGNLARTCRICDQVGLTGLVDHAPDCPFSVLAERGDA